MAVQSSNSQEVMLTNTSPTTGGPRSNVVALKHMHANGVAGMRFMRTADGQEIGALGHQNGASGFYLENTTFIAATAPLDPETSEMVPNEPPGRLVLGQEGYYQGVERRVARIVLQPDWSIRINDPTGAEIVTMTPAGNLVWKKGYQDIAAVDPPPAPGRWYSRLYAEETAGGVQRLMVVFPNGERKVLAEESS